MIMFLKTPIAIVFLQTVMFKGAKHRAHQILTNRKDYKAQSAECARWAHHLLTKVTHSLLCHSFLIMSLISRFIILYSTIYTI